MGKTFERIEKKYKINKQQYTLLREYLKDYMEEDEYGKHTISNIYYDTDDYSLIRTSLEKPNYKEKFRIRCYGTPDNDSPTFLEIKKKYSSVVYKRRISLPFGEVDNFMNDYNPNSDDFGTNQISNEIKYFMGMYNPKPKVFIGYDRVALFGKEDNSFRLTFDENIRYRVGDLDLSNGSYGTNILEDDVFLMEVKVLGSMPLWFSSILSELEIFSSSFSKYGYAYTNYILPEIRHIYYAPEYTESYNNKFAMAM